MRAFAGVDVGLQTSVLVVVDVTGGVLIRMTFAMDGQGHLEALRTLRACAGRRRDGLQVAVEDPTSPLSSCLVEAGFMVLAVHGVTLARFRLGQSVARSKSDRGDALTLANIIRLQPGVHHPVPRDTPAVLALRARTRAYEERRRQLRKLQAQLWSQLNRYYAAALPCLAARASRDMHAALTLAPTPAAALRLRPRRLAAALKQAGRHRLNEQAAAAIITELRVRHPGSRCSSSSRRAPACWTSWRSSRCSSSQPTVCNMSRCRPPGATGCGRSSSRSRRSGRSPGPGCWPSSVTTRTASTAPGDCCAWPGWRR